MFKFILSCLPIRKEKKSVKQVIYMELPNGVKVCSSLLYDRETGYHTSTRGLHCSKVPLLIIMFDMIY